METNYILRSELGSESKFVEVGANSEILVVKGAVYTLIDPSNLEPIDLILGTRLGNSLVVTLPNGNSIEFIGFFPDNKADLKRAYASFSSEHLLQFIDLEEEEENEDSGGFALIPWFWLGIGSAGALLVSSGDGESNINVSVAGDTQTNPSTGDNNIQSDSPKITGVSNRRVDELSLYQSNTPTAENLTGEVTWSLEGADSAYFLVDSLNGKITQRTALNFESPLDFDGDNTYQITLVATDEKGVSARKPLSINVTNTIEQSTISIESLYDVTVVEGNDTYWNLPKIANAIGEVQYFIEGDDASRFFIDDRTLTLSFSGQDFENPADKNRDNEYKIRLVALDEDGNTASKEIKVNVLDNENEFEPTADNSGGDITVNVDTPDINIEGSATTVEGSNTVIETGNSGQTDGSTQKDSIVLSGISDQIVREGSRLIYEASVEGTEGDVSWSILGADSFDGEVILLEPSDDGKKATITFNAQDFEKPLDSDKKNDYEFTVVVSDSTGSGAMQKSVIRVVDYVAEIVTGDSGENLETYPEYFAVNEGDIITIPEFKYQDNLASVIWSLSGNDKNSFSLDNNILTQLGPFDFEKPIDMDLDNNYELKISAIEAISASVVFENLELRDISIEAKEIIALLFNVMVISRNTENTPEQNAQLFWQEVARLIENKESLVDLLNLNDSLRSDSGLFAIAYEEILNKPTINAEISEAEISSLFESDNLIKTITWIENQLGQDSIFRIAFNDQNESLLSTPEGQVFYDVDNIENLSSYRSENGIESLSFDQFFNDVKIGSKQTSYPQSSSLITFFNNEIIGRFADSNYIQMLANDLVSPANGFYGESEPRIYSKLSSIDFTVAVKDVENEGQVLNPSSNEIIIQSDNNSISTYPRYVAIRENEQSLEKLPLPTIKNKDNFEDWTWSLTGPDYKLFDIDPATGSITPKVSFNFELPYDIDLDNTYEIKLIATSLLANESVEKEISILVEDVSEGGETGNNSEEIPSLIRITSSTSDGVYGLGEVVELKAVFSTPVMVSNLGVAPSLILNNGGEASYVSGSGTNEVLFEYVVSPSDFIQSLDITKILIGSTKSISGTPFSAAVIEDIPLNLSESVSIGLDSSPRIVSIDSDSSGVVNTGDHIDIKITFDQGISFTDSGSDPAILALNNGAQAEYLSRLSDKEFIFRYTVMSGDDIDLLDVLAFAENSASFKNIGGLDASDVIQSSDVIKLSDNTQISVGDYKAAEIINIDFLQPDGTYIKGDYVDIKVIFDQDILITKEGMDFDLLSEADKNLYRPYLALNTGSVANYVSMSDSNSLVFRYELQEGDIVSALNVLSLAENGTDFSTVHDKSVNVGLEDFDLTQSRAITIDAKRPKIISIENQEEPRELVGEKTKVSGKIIVNFDEAISVIGDDAKLILSGIDDLNNPMYPAIGLLDSEFPSDKSISFSYEGLLIDELIDLDVTALLENSTSIIDLSGNNASTAINYGVNDIAGTLLAGAGEFVSELIGYRVFDENGIQQEGGLFSPSDKDFRFSTTSSESQYFLVEVFDANGDSPDYIDEFTGELKNLSSEVESLRVVVTRDQLYGEFSSQVNATPLSELAVRIVEYVRKSNDSDIFPIDAEYLLANQLVSNLFQVESSAIGDISFTTSDSFDFSDGLSNEEKIGAALAVLSVVDSRTGSIDSTLEKLLSNWISDINSSNEGETSLKYLRDFFEEAINVLATSDAIRNKDAILSHAKEIVATLNGSPVIEDASSIDSELESNEDATEVVRTSIEEDSAVENLVSNAEYELQESNSQASDTVVNNSTPRNALVLNSSSDIFLIAESLSDLQARIINLVTKSSSAITENSQIAIDEISKVVAAYEIVSKLKGDSTLSTSDLFDAFSELDVYLSDELERDFFLNDLASRMRGEGFSDNPIAEISNSYKKLISLQNFRQFSSLQLETSSSEVPVIYQTSDELVVPGFQDLVSSSEVLGDIIANDNRVYLNLKNPENLSAVDEISFSEAIFQSDELYNVKLEGKAEGSWVDIPVIDLSDNERSRFELPESAVGFEEFRFVLLSDSAPSSGLTKANLVSKANGDNSIDSGSDLFSDVKNISISQIGSLFDSLNIDSSAALAQFRDVMSYLDSLSPIYESIHGFTPNTNDLIKMGKFCVFFNQNLISDGNSVFKDVYGEFAASDLYDLVNINLPSEVITELSVLSNQLIADGVGVRETFEIVTNKIKTLDTIETLNSDLSTLYERVDDISSREDYSEAWKESEYARLNSIFKLKSALSGNSGTGGYDFTLDDFENYGFELESEEIAKLVSLRLLERDKNAELSFEEFSEIVRASLESFDQASTILENFYELKSETTILSKVFDENDLLNRGFFSSTEPDSTAFEPLEESMKVSLLKDDYSVYPFEEIKISTLMLPSVLDNIEIECMFYNADMRTGAKVDLSLISSEGSLFYRVPEWFDTTGYKAFELFATGPSESVAKISELELFSDPLLISKEIVDALGFSEYSDIDAANLDTLAGFINEEFGVQNLELVKSLYDDFADLNLADSEYELSIEQWLDLFDSQDVSSLIKSKYSSFESAFGITAENDIEASVTLDQSRVAGLEYIDEMKRFDDEFWQ